MNTTSGDAKSFVKEVTRHLSSHGAGQLLTKRVGTLFQKMSTAAAGRQNAVVSSTVSLTGDEQRKLSLLLTKASGSPVTITYRVQSDFLSGLKIRMGDMLIDTSGKQLLSDMTHTLSSS